MCQLSIIQSQRSTHAYAQALHLAGVYRRSRDTAVAGAALTAMVEWATRERRSDGAATKSEGEAPTKLKLTVGMALVGARAALMCFLVYT